LLNTPKELVHWIIDHKGEVDATDGGHYAHGPAGDSI